jgi:hypothetical protein
MRYIKFLILVIGIVLSLWAELSLATPASFQGYSYPIGEREGWMIVLLLSGLGVYQLIRSNHKSNKNFLDSRRRISKNEEQGTIGEIIKEAND